MLDPWRTRSKPAVPPAVYCAPPVSSVVALPLVRVSATEKVPAVTTLLSASRTLTVPRMIGLLPVGKVFGDSAQLRWSALPAVHTAVAHTPYAPALLNTNVALPPSVLVEPR